MIRRDDAAGAKRRAGGALQGFDYLFGFMFVLPDNPMYMIGHDGRGVAGVARVPDGVAQCRGDKLNLSLVKANDGKLQPWLGPLVELADFARPGWICLRP